MKSFELGFEYEESPAANQGVSLFVKVRFESRTMNDILDIDKFFYAIAYFGQTGHRFRFQLDTHSGSKWTVIPDQTGQIGAKRWM